MQYGRARNVGKLVHRTNICGGDNKTGLPTRIGPISNRLAINCGSTCGVPKVCVAKKYLFSYRPGRHYLG